MVSPSGGLLRRSSVEGGGCDLVAAALPLWGEESELVESSSSEEEDDGASPGGTRKAQRNKNTPATRRARGKSDSRAWDPAEAFLEPDSLSDDDADDERAPSSRKPSAMPAP